MKGDGVSEVIGAIILISVAVLAMGIVILVLFAGPLPTSVPAFAGIISNSSRTVYISHEGGDTLYTGQFKILVDGVDETYNFTKSLSGPFSLGKVMSATLPNMPGRVVMVFNTSWGGGTVLLSADLVHVIPFTPAGWYSSNWLKRKKTTINPSKVSGSLTDFPVLISIADLRLQGYAQSNGNDILFTSSDGTTKLAHEIEYYDSNGGTLVAWVKVPSVTSASDTVIYMYYNNSAASSQQDYEGVWDSNFKGVWHMAEDPSSTADGDCGGGSYHLCDSTSRSNDGTTYGSMTSGDRVAGKIGTAWDFDGTNDMVRIKATTDFNPNIITVEAWIKTSSTEERRIMVNYAGAPNEWYFTMDEFSGGGRVIYSNSGAADQDRMTPSSYANGNWHHAVAVADSTPANIKIYMDGSPSAVVPGPAGEGWSWAFTNTPSIGAGALSDHSSWEAGFPGQIDEVRVSTGARSSGWILTEYNNQNDPGTFLSLSTEQTQTTMS
jgi:MSHA biogenesis protein MshQ